MTVNGNHHRLADPSGTASARLTSEQVRQHDLPRARWGRGYREDEVRRVLGAAADRIQALEFEVLRLSRMLQLRELEIEQRRYGVGLPTNGKHAELVHGKQVDWQMQAQAYSDEVTATAQAQANQIVGEAHHQAQLIRAQAQMEVERYRTMAGAAYTPAEEDLVRLRSLAHSMRDWLHDVRRHVVAADDTFNAELGRYDRHHTSDADLGPNVAASPRP